MSSVVQIFLSAAHVDSDKWHCIKKKKLIVLAYSMFAFHFIVPYIGSVGVIFNWI